jgi:hypothetical protein
LIVPFTPGTGIDLVARTVGPKLGERLGRPVVVDNRAGASGNIGTEAVVRARPDGQTLLVSVNTLVMNASLYPKLSFDPVRDLVPVALTSWGQLLLVANPKSGFSSAGELIKAATGEEPTMWGPAIVGFGSVKLRYADERELDWPLVGFSPRKANMTLYVVSKSPNQASLLEKLGPHKTSVSCLYIKRLADVDENVLLKIIKDAAHYNKNNAQC